MARGIGRERLKISLITLPTLISQQEALDTEYLGPIRLQEAQQIQVARPRHSHQIQVTPLQVSPKGISRL